MHHNWISPRTYSQYAVDKAASGVQRLKILSRELLVFSFLSFFLSSRFFGFVIVLMFYALHCKQCNGKMLRKLIVAYAEFDWFADLRFEFTDCGINWSMNQMSQAIDSWRTFAFDHLRCSITDLQINSMRLKVRATMSKCTMKTECASKQTKWISKHFFLPQINVRAYLKMINLIWQRFSTPINRD